nr:hypothetical protein [uncultured Niameybacter sp.]
MYKEVQESHELEGIQVQVLNGEQLLKDSLAKCFRSIKCIYYNGVDFNVNAMDKILYEQVTDDEYMLKLLLNGKVVLTEVISRNKKYRVEWNENTQEYYFEIFDLV